MNKKNQYQPTHEVRDPVYGFIKLSQVERKIINCHAFQRLRDIRQLAMGHMVYPGANHTRFEHSLGCLHLATEMFDALVEDEDNAEILRDYFTLEENDWKRARQILRLAALLHDVGHSPFSHSGEGLLPNKLTHEDMTVQLIRESDISKIIQTNYAGSNITSDEIIAVATDINNASDSPGPPLRGLLNELLTGELGADRIDYLLRDAYHSGQKTGDFDYRRLIGCLKLLNPPKETASGPRIGLGPGGWLVAEHMIVARYLMYQSLYFHPVKRIYERYLEQFTKQWLNNQSFPSNTLEYIRLTDSILLNALHRAAFDPEVAGHKYAKPFWDRSHMRLAHEVILADNVILQSDPNNPQQAPQRLPDKQRFTKLKKEVTCHFGDDQILCDEPDHSATKIYSSKILVLHNKKVRSLDQISEIVRGMSTKIWRGRIYAREDQCDKVHDWCEQWLQQNTN